MKCHQCHLDVLEVGVDFQGKVSETWINIPGVGLTRIAEFRTPLVEAFCHNCGERLEASPSDVMRAAA